MIWWQIYLAVAAAVFLANLGVELRVLLRPDKHEVAYYRLLKADGDLKTAVFYVGLGCLARAAFWPIAVPLWLLMALFTDQLVHWVIDRGYISKERLREIRRALKD